MSTTDISDDELDQILTNNTALEALSHPRLQDVSIERAFGNETFVAKLADALGLVHESELEASVTATSKDDDTDDRLEAYGTGVSGQRESTPAEIEAAREAEGDMWDTSDDLDDYTTGVDGGADRPREERDELTAEQRENIRAARSGNQPSDPLEAFGTGVQGDTSREEHRERERRVDELTEALARSREEADE